MDGELKYNLLNKLVANSLWAKRVKDKIRRGFYRDAQADLSWVVKCTEEAIDLLRKENEEMLEVEGVIHMVHIEIKDLTVLNLHPILIPIVLYAMDFSGLNIITSGHRPEDPGVHGQMPSRGADLRCWDKQTGMIVEQEINEKWIYDPERPKMLVCLAHDTGQGFHLHFQCHQNTVKK